MKHYWIVLTVLLCWMVLPAAAEPEETAGQTDGYKAAAPYSHTVSISRSGRVLKLNYQLIGADGKPYSLLDITGRDYSKTPTVAIYKGDLQVASGSFEYG